MLTLLDLMLVAYFGFKVDLPGWLWFVAILNEIAFHVNRSIELKFYKEKSSE